MQYITTTNFVNSTHYRLSRLGNVTSAFGTTSGFPIGIDFAADVGDGGAFGASAAVRLSVPTLTGPGAAPSELGPDPLTRRWTLLRNPFISAIFFS
jgi:hypothetical protein